MRLTAEKAVGDRPVDTDKKDALETWVNREARPLLGQIRKGLNARGIERPDPVDSDGAGTYSTLWTSPELPNDCAWELEARVAGVGGTVRATYALVQTVESIAGVVAASGATTTLHSYESAAACDARFTVDAANRVVYLEARDDAGTAMRWTATVYTQEGVAAE